jgi:hypothetical protein
MTSAFTGLRVEAGFDFGLEALSEELIELSRLLSGFLAAVVRFVAAGTDEVPDGGLLAVRAILVGAEAGGIVAPALLRTEARVTFPVVVLAIEDQ